MCLFRYVVHKCLVTNFAPTASVKQAMNNTFVQALQKQVDAEVAETRKIVRRCESEAEATTKALQGQGVSLMRRAYVNGMQVCVVDAKIASSCTDRSQHLFVINFIDGNNSVSFIHFSGCPSSSSTDFLQSELP